MDESLIFDVGMHEGQDTDFYLSKGFRVVAVEASPALCAEVSSRLRSYVDSGQLIIKNVAIAESSGPITFYLNPVSVWNTTRPDWSERNRKLGSPATETILVDGVEFDELVTKYGAPYYLKVDIEGADMLCIESLAKLNDLPRYVSVESNKTSWSELKREFAVLRSLGYRRFKVVNQARVPRQRLPKPAIEGNYVEHRFPGGASGSFGEEAPGRWLTEREALRKYWWIFVGYRLVGDAGILTRPTVLRRGADLVGLPGWFDTHATV
jgi:FkbM family methyltransferase